MEKEDIKIEAPFTIAGVTLVPIVRTRLNSWRSQRGISVFGIKEPVSFVAVFPKVKKAFRVSGEEVPLDEFVAEVPDIQDVLENL